MVTARSIRAGKNTLAVRANLIDQPFTAPAAMP
jgi:hypothetical protein